MAPIYQQCPYFARENMRFDLLSLAITLIVMCITRYPVGSIRVEPQPRPAVYRLCGTVTPIFLAPPSETVTTCAVPAAEKLLER